jgi:hypothetical protein
MATDKNIRGDEGETAELGAESLWTEAQTAEFLNLTVKALQARRQRGDPPAYVKLGPSKRAPVRYPPKGVREMVSAGHRTSTSQTATE